MDRVQRAAALLFFGGKLPEGKFLRARFCYDFNFGPFFVCCVEGLFVCKTRAGGLVRFNLFQRSKGMLHFAQRLITQTQ